MSTEQPTPRLRRVTTIIVSILATVVLVAVAGWLLLLPDVEQAPVAAVLDDPDLTVTIDGDGATISPAVGGAMAASFLSDTPRAAWDGIVLWGAYPAGNGLADRDDLAAVSIAGSQDGLTTTDEVEQSVDDLPPHVDVRILDGVNHAQFGAYGDQRGDGQAEVPDDVARERIATATAAAMTAGEG